MGDYQRGYKAATARDKYNLAASLRLRMEDGLSEQTARDIFADTFGVMEADMEFGPDPRWAHLE